MTREITHMKAFAAALDSLGKPRFAVGKIAPSKRLGCRTAGVLTGGFTAQALVQAGCKPVLADIRDLGSLLGESR
jgi:hypothetical protein